MNNLKRVLSLALSGIMLVGMMTVGASAAGFSDADKISNTEAVDTMVALNIINGKDDGSYGPEEIVTRSQMAKMITIMLNGGSEPALTASAENAKFSDIGGHWAQKYIEYCASQGVIAGRGDGTFAPDAPVTGTEAAKMALTALGYNSDVFEFVGIDWAIKVNATANAPAANLYEGLRTVDPSAGLSRDNAALMLYNALDANVVEITYDINSSGVTTGYRISDTKTMMTEKFGATKVEGIVIGNEIATIGEDSAADKGETVIRIVNAKEGDKFADKAEVTLKTSTGVDLLGRTVSVYLKKGAKASGADIMGNLVLTDADKVVTNTSGKALADLAKDNKLTLGKDNVYPNYGIAAAATPVAGNTTIMIDNDGDKTADYIFVVSYSVNKIKKINTKDEYVTFEGLSRQDLENVVGYEDFDEGDYVLATKLGGKYYLAAPETVEGELEELKGNGKTDDDYAATKLTVDGTTYDVSAATVGATDLVGANTLTKDDLEVEAVFYLDANDKIVAMGEATTAAAQYAISWGGASGNVIDSNRIKLTLEDGSTNTYTIDSKSDLKISGDNGQYFSGTGADGKPLAEKAQSSIGTLVSYTIKSNGNVSLKLVATTEKTAAFESGKTLVGGEASNNSTLFFHVETNEKTGADLRVTDVEVFEGYKKAPSTESGKIAVAVSEKTEKVVAAVFVDPVTSTGKAKVADHLYLKSTDTANKNYTNAKVVLAGGEETTIKVAAGESTDKGLYLYTINSDGYYELDKVADEATDSYISGTVKSVGSDTVVITGKEGDTELFLGKYVEVDATKDSDGVLEKGATVEAIFDKESEEILMLVITVTAPEEEDDGKVDEKHVHDYTEFAPDDDGNPTKHVRTCNGKVGVCDAQTSDLEHAVPTSNDEKVTGCTVCDGLSL